MPIPTQAPDRPLSQPQAADRQTVSPAALTAAGAAYASAELLIGLAIGRFFTLGRAEALLFFALRPWLLLAAVLLAARLPLRQRIGLGGAALLLASISQTLFLAALGASNPLPEAAKGLLAGLLLIVAMDVVIQLARRLLPRLGRTAGAAALVMLLLLPNGLRPYEVVVMGGAGTGEAAAKPDLMLLTALPLVWGEAGPLDTGSKPAAAFRLLEREFAIRPLDVLDRASLGSGRLFLLAQPRALAPSEFVALDDWVRNGGRALILTDPQLLWPSELPLGDRRRAPAIGLLGPLLTHWGLRLDPPAEPRPVIQKVGSAGVNRRLMMFAPGRFAAADAGGCIVALGGALADCRIGKGRAILLADADMLHDRLWVGSIGSGTERHTRLADNPLVIADQLDVLAGVKRQRLAGDVQWLDPAADPRLAVALGLLPLLLAATPGIARAVRRSR
jgi:hypothetical protein